MACEEVREEESAGSPGVRWATGVGANGGIRRGRPESPEKKCYPDRLRLWVVRCFIGAIFGHSQVPGPQSLEIPANEFSLCDSSP